MYSSEGRFLSNFAFPRFGVPNLFQSFSAEMEGPMLWAMSCGVTCGAQLAAPWLLRAWNSENLNDGAMGMFFPGIMTHVVLTGLWKFVIFNNYVKVQENMLQNWGTHLFWLFFSNSNIFLIFSRRVDRRGFPPTGFPPTCCSTSQFGGRFVRYQRMGQKHASFIMIYVIIIQIRNEHD